MHGSHIPSPSLDTFKIIGFSSLNPTSLYRILPRHPGTIWPGTVFPTQTPPPISHVAVPEARTNALLTLGVSWATPQPPQLSGGGLWGWVWAGTSGWEGGGGRERYRGVSCMWKGGRVRCAHSLLVRKRSSVGRRPGIKGNKEFPSQIRSQSQNQGKVKVIINVLDREAESHCWLHDGEWQLVMIKAHICV